MQFSAMEQEMTICAISTPHGVGGIAVARVSGHDAISIVDKIWQGKRLAAVASHTAHLGTVLDADGNMLDQAVATVFRAPASFTGEDVVEISVHGSVYVQQALLQSLLNAGATLAAPGEFTRRAFASGKFDLTQAEAIADLISSENKAAHRIAINQMRGKFSAKLKELRNQMLQLASLLELELDFSEEDVEFASREKLLALAREIKTEVERLSASFKAGHAIKNGIPVAIVGATNAGKSSLLNALLDDERAIVSDIHGTTRDIVEDTLSIGDYQFRLKDTAGLRHTDDTIENMGITRSLKAASSADIILYVIDASDPKEIDLPDTDAHIIRIANKSDIAAASIDCDMQISAKSGQGIDQLKRTMLDIARQAEHSSSVLVTNLRHYQSLRLASESITRVIQALDDQLSGDLVAIDLRLTIQHLSDIIGDIPSSEILASIFSRFCIGK